MAYMDCITFPTCNFDIHAVASVLILDIEIIVLLAFFTVEA